LHSLPERSPREKPQAARNLLLSMFFGTRFSTPMKMSGKSVRRRRLGVRRLGAAFSLCLTQFQGGVEPTHSKGASRIFMRSGGPTGHDIGARMTRSGSALLQPLKAAPKAPGRPTCRLTQNPRLRSTVLSQHEGRTPCARAPCVRRVRERWSQSPAGRDPPR
jgi:hypothetical protein